MTRHVLPCPLWPDRGRRRCWRRSAPQAAQFINILTGGTGGVYYPLGVALSKIYAEHIKDVQAFGAVDQGLGREPQPVEPGQGRGRLHPRRLARRRLDGQQGGRLQAQAHQAAHAGRDLSQLHPDRRAQERPASRRWPTSRASACRSARPSRAPSSTPAPSSRAAGMSYKDLGQVQYLPFSESVELMKNRQLDATLISAGLGVSAIRDLCASVDCVIVLDSEIGDRQDRLALPVGADPGRHLQGQRPGRRHRGGAELSGHPLGLSTQEVYEMTKCHLRQSAGVAGRPCGGQGDLACRRPARTRRCRCIRVPPSSIKKRACCKATLRPSARSRTVMPGRARGRDPEVRGRPCVARDSRPLAMRVLDARARRCAPG